MEDNRELSWRKSSYSSNGGGNCVEVAGNLPGVVAVRDSKDPQGSKLTFATGAWSEFIKGIKHGEFGL